MTTVQQMKRVYEEGVAFLEVLDRAPTHPPVRFTCRDTQGGWELTAIGPVRVAIALEGLRADLELLDVKSLHAGERWCFAVPLDTARVIVLGLRDGGRARTLRGVLTQAEEILLHELRPMEIPSSWMSAASSPLDAQFEGPPQPS